MSALRIKSLKFVPPVFPGWTRRYVECCKCQRVYADQYQPYSLSTPVRVLPCGHMHGDRTLADEQAAMRRMIEQHEADLALEHAA